MTYRDRQRLSCCICWQYSGFAWRMFGSGGAAAIVQSVWCPTALLTNVSNWHIVQGHAVEKAVVYPHFAALAVLHRSAEDIPQSDGEADPATLAAAVAAHADLAGLRETCALLDTLEQEVGAKQAA